MAVGVPAWADAAPRTLMAACSGGVGDVSDTGSGDMGGLVWAIRTADGETGDTISLGAGCTYTLTGPYTDGASPTLGKA